MIVLYYQLIIFGTLVAVRLFRSKYLLHACLAWSAFTIINLFFPPLIIVQLIVVWGTYALLRPREKNDKKGGSSLPIRIEGLKKDIGNSAASARKFPRNMQTQSVRTKIVPETQRTTTSKPVSSVFDRMTEKSRAVSGALDAASRGLDDIHERLRIKHAVSTVNFNAKTAYAEEKSFIRTMMQSAVQKLEIQQSLDGDPELREIYNQTFAYFNKLDELEGDEEAQDKLTNAFTSGQIEKLEIKKSSDSASQTRKHYNGINSVFDNLDEEEGDEVVHDNLPTAERNCVEFLPPARDRDADIADAVERDFLKIISEHSSYLLEVKQKLDRNPKLRAIFEEEMKGWGGAKIVARIDAVDRTHKKVDLHFEETAKPLQLKTVVNKPDQISTAAEYNDVPAFSELVRQPKNSTSPVTNPGSTLPKNIQDTRIRRFPAPFEKTEDRKPELKKKNKTATPRRYATDGEVIQDFAIIFQIPYLVHFTRAANLPSIMANGLRSIEQAVEMGLKPLVNDQERWDGRRDGISLSISFPNHSMFWKYRQLNQGEEWAILIIEPSILWTKSCAFCKHNAADKRISSQTISDLMTASSFTAMFNTVVGNKSREDQNLMSFQTTDVQAEVLVFDVIEPQDITGVVFEGTATRNTYKPCIGDRKTYVHSDNRGLFAARGSSFADMGTL